MTARLLLLLLLLGAIVLGEEHVFTCRDDEHIVWFGVGTAEYEGRISIASLTLRCSDNRASRLYGSKRLGTPN